MVSEFPTLFLFNAPVPLVTIYLEVEYPVKIAELPKLILLFPKNNLPLVKVILLLILTSPERFMPFALLIVRPDKVTEGKSVLMPEPPKIILEFAPPVREPFDFIIEPFKVKVFEPIEKEPFVKV